MSTAPVELNDPLAEVGAWGAAFAAAGASRGGRTVGVVGDVTRSVPVASISKLVTAWATLLAVEEGATSLDAPAGPPGSTVGHLLCHAGGYDFDGPTVLAAPGTRRIYSNTGYEVLATHVEGRTGIPFADYAAEGVLGPLGMADSSLRGSPAKDLRSSVADLLLLAAEMRSPSLLHPDTVSDARSPQLPDLDGVLPGWGPQHPCWWGLGPELRGTKSPHWTGATAPPRTFGHFGGSGTLLWVDPVADVACVALTDRTFGPWAVDAWPGFSDRVRAWATAATPVS